jgi:hypothetical protein
MTILRLVAFMFVLVQTAAPKPPVTIGSSAAKSSAQNLADLEKLAGGRAWLISASPSQFGVEFLELYLPPTTATPELRRGTVAVVENGRSVSTHSYAQVAIPDRAFDDIKGETDANRPFAIQDGIAFDDAELVSIVRFIRSKPTSPVTNVIGRSGIVDGALPIWSIGRITQTRPQLNETAGQIRVTLRLSDFKGIDVLLEKKEQTWVVISALQWEA